ncbi:MAG: hypothetical protein IJW53_01950 [Clostridia bacterium]|nr:hypothetical protein [Clostridia bacterium]
MNKNIEGVGEVAVPSTPKEKIQNFIYHYKWHTVVALLLVIAIVVCSLQFCGKEEYDAYILYAGSKSIGRTAKDGDVAEIATVISSLKRITDDFDENGEVTINFTNYYFLSADERKNLTDLNEALLANDQKSISGVLEHSEYYLLFISVAVYEQYHKVGDEELFISLSDYKASSPDIELYADNAILLSSTEAYKLPGLSALPDDTLICIRRPSVLGGKSNEHKEYLENAKEMLENILELDLG